MSEVTINIPAEHIEEIRNWTRLELQNTAVEEVGDQFNNRGLDAIRAGLTEVRRYESILDQIGWEGPTAEREITADRGSLREVLQHMVETAGEAITASPRFEGDTTEALSRAQWACGLFDGILAEPEKVGAA